MPERMGTLRVPDPRCWSTESGGNTLLTLASQAREPAVLARLSDELHACLEQGADQAIFAALRLAPSAAAYRHLWQQACAAAARPRCGEAAVGVRIFALPVVLVAAARQKIALAGILAGIAEIRAVLETHGALGATRNFGLGNALVSLSMLERITPSEVWRWSRDFTAAMALRDIAAETIGIAPGRERVEVRFLVGAGIASCATPSFAETAAAIGSWGMPLTRLLAQQLAQPGVELLPLPRPPLAILEATHAGRCAQLELAFSLFVSNTVRQFRATVGEPTVVLAAHRDEAGAAELRVSMSSALDDTLLEGFRWPLHPLDDFDRVVESVVGLLRDCHLGDIRAVESVLAGGVPPQRALFFRGRDLERCALR